MNWIFFALLSPAIYAVVNFIDKYIIEKKVKDYSAMPIFGSITGFVVGTAFWFLFNKPSLPTQDAVLLLLSGMLTIWGAAFYFKALSMTETSKIILFFQAVPLFVLFFSFVFLKETLTLMQLMGFGFVFIATCLAAIEKKGVSFVFNKALVYILIVDIFWAVATILVKFTANANSFVKILSYESWGIGLGGVVLYFFFPTIRKTFHKTFRKVGRSTLVILFCNELVFVTAKSIAFFAFTIGPTAQVSVIGGSQVFFGILYGWLLTKRFPKIFKEHVHGADLAKKIALAIMVLIGIYFMV